MRDPNRPRPEGWDSMTPRQRMESLGYEFDEDGNTIETGYGPETPWETDPWGYIDERHVPPDLTVRCSAPYRRGTCGESLAKMWKLGEEYFWRASFGPKAPPKSTEQKTLELGTATAWRAEATMPEEVIQHVIDKVDARPRMTLQGTLDDTYREDGVLIMWCSQHGPIGAHRDLLRTKADSTRRKLDVNPKVMD